MSDGHNQKSGFDQFITHNSQTKNIYPFYPLYLGPVRLARLEGEAGQAHAIQAGL